MQVYVASYGSVENKRDKQANWGVHGWKVREKEIPCSQSISGSLSPNTTDLLAFLETILTITFSSCQACS